MPWLSHFSSTFASFGTGRQWLAFTDKCLGQTAKRLRESCQLGWTMENHRGLVARRSLGARRVGHCPRVRPGSESDKGALSNLSRSKLRRLVCRRQLRLKDTEPGVTVSTRCHWDLLLRLRDGNQVAVHRVARALSF